MIDAQQVLQELATEAGDVRVEQADARTEYFRADQLFALSDADGAFQLRLLPDVAEAARRTPDTHASVRGDDWVRFAPPTWNDHARDRLEAWFRVAWRIAEQD